jgi:hypothetical protein
LLVAVGVLIWPAARRVKVTLIEILRSEGWTAVLRNDPGPEA